MIIKYSWTVDVTLNIHVLRFCSILRRLGPTAFDGNERMFAEILLIRDARLSQGSQEFHTVG